MPIIGGGAAAAAAGSGGVITFGTQAADVSTAGTTFAAGQNVLSSNLTFAADGSSTYGVFLSALGQINSASGQNSASAVIDGAQSSGFLMFAQTYSATASLPCTYMQPITGLSAASHTVNVRVWVSAGTGKIYSGTSFAGALITVYVMKLG